MEISVSQELGAIIGYARDEAMRTGHYGIGPDHLALGMLRHGENEACRSLPSLGIDASVFKNILDGKLFRETAIPYSDEDRIRLTRRGLQTLNLSVYESIKWKQSSASAEHLLIALLMSEGSVSSGFLKASGLSYDSLTHALEARGLLGAVPDPVLPKAEEIASALEAELRRVISIIPINNSDYYS